MLAEFFTLFPSTFSHFQGLSFAITIRLHFLYVCCHVAFDSIHLSIPTHMSMCNVLAVMGKIIHYRPHLSLTCSGFDSLVIHCLNLLSDSSSLSYPLSFLPFGSEEIVSHLSGSEAKLLLKGVGL